MTENTEYKHYPKDVAEIVPRDFAFEFPDDLEPVWIPHNRVRAHMFNGFSVTMPYLEPFLIRAIMKAKEHVSDPELLEDMTAFNRQEANHFKCHRRYNELLKSKGYPRLAELEDRMTESYARLEKRSLRTQLAYAAGFEAMTNGFTHWLITKRKNLFFGSDSRVASFWLMHMIEETEHKTVAFDAYMAYSGAYLPRVLGVFHGSGHLVGLGVLCMLQMLKTDGLTRRPMTWLRVVKEVFLFAFNVAPFMLRATLPGFNPRKENDPEWAHEWIERYKRLPQGALIPLIDTSNPGMPVPSFEQG